MKIKLTPKSGLCLRTDKVDNFGDTEKQEIFLSDSNSKTRSLKGI